MSNNINIDANKTNYSYTVSLKESLKDRTHLTLDFKGMKPRLKKTLNSNNTKHIALIDTTISPFSLPVELLDSILSSPKKIIQLPHSLKSAVTSEINQFHLQNQQGISIAETPTPTKFIYPKNVTKQQEIFAEGFQKALQKIQSDNKFALSTPLQATYSPNTVKYLISLLTPSSSASHPSQGVPSLLLSSPNSIPILNSTQLPTTASIVSTSLNNVKDNFESKILALSSTKNFNKENKKNKINDCTKDKQKTINENNNEKLENLPPSLFNTVSTSSFNHILKSTNVAVVKSPTYKILSKSSYYSTNTESSFFKEIIDTTKTKNNNNLSSFCKLDCNNLRYMEFLQQQQIDNTNFVSNYSSSNNNTNKTNNSNLNLLPLNFVHTPTLANVTSINEHQHQDHISTSQPQLQMHSTHSQQIVISSEQQRQQMLIKHENINNFLHVDTQQTSLESNGSSRDEINLQQSSSLQIRNRFNHLNQKKNLSNNNNNILINHYGIQNLSFDEDHEQKKLDRKRARNRMAASKCRQRKIERINELEDQVRIYKDEGLMLQNQIQSLKQEVIDLNEAINRHRSSGCSINMTFKISNI